MQFITITETALKSENFGTTPRRGTLPDSLTKFEEKSLHISRNLANIAVKLRIR